MIIKFIIPLLSISIVIAIHELGHFLAAKLFGVKVDVFSVGIGKKILQLKKRDTIFAISIIPIGGYCKLKGGDIENPSSDIDSIDVLNPLKKAIIFFAGPFFNFLLAILVFSITFMTPNNSVIPATIFPVLGKNLPAENVGLQKGDKVLTINNKSINSFSDISNNITEKPLDMHILRNGVEIEFTILPQRNNNQNIIGIYPYIPLKIISSNSKILFKNDEIIAVNKQEVEDFYTLSSIINEVDVIALTVKRDNTTFEISINKEVLNEISFLEKVNYNIFTSLALGTKSTLLLTKNILLGLGNLFKTGEVKDSISSPLRLVYDMGNSISSIYSTNNFLFTLQILLKIIASISLSLCIINLLPIPVVDGGQILINIIIKIKGTPLNKKIIMGYQTVGLMIILLLFTLGISNDIFYFGDL